MTHLRQLSNRVRLVRNLFFLNAAIWLVLGGISLFRMANNDTLPIITLFIIVLLMLGNAGVMVFCGWKIGGTQKPYYYFAVVVVVINLVLTITDEFGIYDFIVLLSNFVLLVSLMAIRSRYA